MHTPIETTNAPRAIGPYSQAILAPPFLYTSGQIGLDPLTGSMVEGGIAAQATQVFCNLEAILQAAKMSFQDVVKTTIFLTDLDDFACVNEIYAHYFETTFPARSTVQVTRLPREAKIEIEAIAYQKN
jgi:2-iminobutanoate/2-iminopropanoate deaminase